MATIKEVDSIHEVAQAALLSGNDAVRFVFGKVPAELAVQANEVLSKPIDSYSCIIDISAARHVFAAHGNAKMEAKQGQVAITVNDFAAFPQIVGQPDKVEYKGNNGQGNPTFYFKKK